MKYVKIQSTKTINVTPGLQAVDNTLTDLHVVDRLKISPSWPKACVLIKRGVHWYPSEITEWPAVKALSRDNVITIGETSDTPEDIVVSSEEMHAKLEEIQEPVQEHKRKRRSSNAVSDDSLESLTE